ncbi:MAG: sodium/solute symporter [Verrucomicrobia bacterium]|nr:sodium/solute symporter [Verrucomicrobiota bacterium]
MNFTSLDLIIFVGFFVAVVGLGVWKSRRARDHAENSADFFLAGRGLTWPLIGISIVAANISTEQMVGMAGQAAGSTGLAVSCWQLMGAVFIVIIAMTLLPRFLRAGIYTMPEFLAYRYNASARAIMAVMTVVIYAVVMLPAVLYSGGVTLRAIAGVPLTQAVWVIGLLATAYAAVGGLKAIAWADLVQGLALLAGGMLVFFLGLNAVGGWENFTTVNADKLHMIKPADNPDLPWTGVVGGMWIVMIYYCGLNQFIVQRNLAAKSLKHGQLGMIFAGGLWLLVPFAIVMPGLMAQQLYADKLATTTDAAFPTLITQLVPAGIRGFIYAAIAGAVTSTLASLLNSASTIATMDVYRNMIRENASQARLVWLGRGLTIVFVVAGCSIAPSLDNPKFGGVFQYIQQFQGYIWPGVVAAFLGAFLLPRAPAAAGVVALVLGPAAYGVLQFTSQTEARPWGHEIHFLLQVLLAFCLVAVVMGLITLARPLAQPKVLPVRADLDMRTDPVVLWSGLAVIAAVAVFFLKFW